MTYVAPLQYTRYDRGPSFGQNASKALVLGLQKIEQTNKDKDAFANQVAQAGGTVDEGVSPERARLNSLMDKFHRRPRILGGSGGGPSDDEIADAEANTSAPPPVSITPSFDDAPSLGSNVATPQPIMRTNKIGNAISATMSPNTTATTGGPVAPAPGQNLSGARDGTMQGRAMPAPSPVVQPSSRIGVQQPSALPQPKRSGISDLLQQATAGVRPYTVKGPEGMTGTIDPLYGARVSSAGKMMDYAFERGARQDEENQSNEEKIQSLVDAGMPEDQARAKVLNNVVSYDEQFGRRTATSGLSFDQRVQLENIKTQRATLLESMKTARKRNDPVAMARLAQEDKRLALAQQHLEVTVGGMEVKEEADPSGVAGIVANSTPEGQAAAAQRKTKRTGIIEGLKTTVGGDGPMKVPLATRVQQLKRAGVSKQQARSILLDEGYKVQ